jgi:ABC-type antimicrobial peptide transport system permease subunit
MALGSVSWNVIAMVVAQAGRLVGVGVVVGGVIAIGVGNLLRSQLFGVQPADPVTFAAVVLILAGVAVAAAALPARRATRIDPVVTLKAD